MDSNPYQAPQVSSLPADRLPREITDELIDRLIAGEQIESICVYDVSDYLLYGCKKRRKLTGDTAVAANEAGCEPVVFQTIYWFCLVGIPLWPMGTYVVLPQKACDDPDGDAEQYRAILVQTDKQQIAWHYGIVVMGFAILGIAIWIWLGRS